nr:immunoglobulin heavy chain junction region [Mus musculus]
CARSGDYGSRRFAYW